MTCKDCYNYELCVAHEQEMSAMLLKGGYRDISNDMADGCRFFKNKKADVVPAVRCKDCRWLLTDDWDGQTLYSCGSTKGLEEPTPDCFCSYGERRCEDG